MAAITADIQYWSFFLLWLISTLLIQYIFKKLTKQTTHLRLPPSPPSLPFIGHIHHLSPSVYRCLHKLSSKYGPLLYLRLGSYPIVVASSASVATQIFKTHDLNFAEKPKSNVGDSLLLGISSFSNAPYGDYWRFMKKLCATELLGTRQLERSRNVRREELVRFLQKLLEKAHKNEAVDLGDELMTLTNNSTCRMAMSTRCSGEDNEAKKCRQLVKGALELVAKLYVANLFGLRKLGFWVYRKQVLDLPERYDKLLEKLLKEHEEKAKRNGGNTKDKDLMDILLEVYHDKNAEIKISRGHMKAFFLDIFLGGTATSSMAMQYIMAELINNPNVYKKLREEIELVVGKNRLVEDSDIPSLHYLQSVVKEGLRLHPPVPIMRRLCRNSCKIGGFDLPEETAVLVNLYSILRDPEVWDNPDEFCPERFLVSTLEQESGEETKRGQNSGFVPFGGGRRMCPGSNLAFSLMNTTVAAMVQCFDWKIGTDGDVTKVNMKEKSGMTMQMAHPLVCLPVVHSNPFSV
ncbi:unnamed protein product [Dovyalis caffra]|uniref:Cytochrome P450 n=1 Tax=Dovyalis caffra TaxID=77055 RepID=A0AAV1R970_9ROSI|nr:unnamed protein product [Dovyalis caffra]